MAKIRGVCVVWRNSL